MRKLSEYADLNLSAEDLQALSVQGFVARHVRGSRIFYKLRFRRGGAQQVRCLGRDPQRAAEIQAALQAWQLPRQELKVLTAQIDALRKNIRPRLAVDAADAGFKLHGRRLRRPRDRARTPPLGA